MTSFDFEPREIDDPDVTLIELGGELDLTNARELEEQLEAAARRRRVLVLDLSRVLFIDSAALRTLFRTARAHEAGMLGIVVSPESSITRTLEIVGLSRVVAVRSSVEEVLAALSSASR